MNKSIKAFFQAFILFLCFFSALIANTIAAPVVESVAISGDKLIVTGHKFLDIDGLILSDPQTGFKKPFKVESATESEIVGRAVDDQKITVASLMNLIIDTAKGETTYPVSFSLQKDAVTNPTIKNGAITPDKFIGVTTANPPDQTVPTWSQATNSFVFTKASAGGGSSGVSEIVLGSGIIGAPNTASGSVPVSVDIGQTGDASKTKIPFFNSTNKIVLDSTNSTTGALSGLSFKDGTLNFDISNDNALRIDSNTATDLFVLDVDGNLSLKGPVTVGGFDVCLSNGNCIPSSGLTLVTATAPLVAAKTATGTTNISAGAVNTANNLVQLESTGRFPANIPGVVRGPGSAARSATLGNLAIFSDTSGEKLGDGGIGLQNLVSMSATPTSANKMVISTGTNKVLGTTTYTVPSTSGVTGQVLGVTATGTTNWVNVSGVTSFNTRTGAVIPQAGDYTAGQVTNLPFGIITATTVQQAIDQLADLDSQKLPKAGGTMTGTITTSTQNALKIGPFATGTGEVQFLETAANGTNYVGFKAAANIASNTVWTLPAADGSSGTVLSTNGSKQLAWTSLGAAGVGNVVGPATSATNTIPAFAGTDGKTLKTTAFSIIGNNLQGPKVFMGDNTVFGPNMGCFSHKNHQNSFNTPGFCQDSDGSIYVGTDVAYFMEFRIGQNSKLTIDDQAIRINDSVFINDNLNVGPGLLFVEKLSGRVGIGTTEPVQPLQVDSKIGGFLPPRMTTSEKNAIPTQRRGLVVFDTDLDALNIRNSTGWISLASGTGDVVGPATATLNSVARYESGKVIKESGITIDDANNISGIVQLNGKVVDNFITGSGLVGNLPIFGLLPSEIEDSGIALINIPTMASNATAQFHPILSGGNNKSQIAAPYTLPNTACLAGEVLKWNATGFTCQSDFGGSGDVAGPATSSSNTLAQFSDSTGKIIKGTAWTVPNSIGLPGQYLSVVGGQDLGWTSFPDTLVYVGGAPVVVDNLPKFGGSDGTQIIDSGIATANVPTMVAAAASSNTIILSGGADKTLKTTGYTIPSSIGTANFVLKSDGTNANWQADAAGTGDVAGPATATLNSIARYESGKVIKESGIIIDDANNISGVAQLNTKVANNLVTGTGIGVDRNLPVYSGMSPTEIEDSGISLDNIATMSTPSNAVGNILTSAGLDKSIVDSGIAVTAIPRLASPTGSPNKILLSADSNSGIKTSNYTVPPNIGSATYILKSDGTNAQWAPDASGTGDVMGPPSAASTNLAAFNGTTGKLIADSGVGAANVVTKDNNFSAANRLAVAAGNNKKLTETGYTIPNAACGDGEVLKFTGGNLGCAPDTAGTGDVAGPATATQNSVARYESGKIIKESGIIIDDANNISGINNLNGIVVNNLITGTGLAGNLSIFGTLPSELEDSGIASINIPTMASNATAAFHPILSGGANKSQIAAPYTFPNTTCLAGEVLKWNATGFTCQADFGGTGNVVGPATSTLNNFAAFSDGAGKIIKDSGINSGNLPTMATAATAANQIIISAGPGKQLTNTLYPIPAAIGASGTVLKSDGTIATWQSDNSGSGDVLGPASSSANNLASFNNTTGKLIQDSGVSSTNLMTMTSPAAGAGNILTSQGANKIAIDSDIIIDGSSNVTGMGTLNGRAIANFVDGPAIATSTNLAAFNGITGKLIADSGVGAANVVTKDNNFSAANRLALSAGNNKKLSETGYTIPQAACGNGEVLKFSGGNLGCAPDTAGTGDVAGPATATQNSVARYESGKVIKESGIIIDDANNISGINNLNGIVVNNLITGSGLVGNLPIFGLLPSELEDSGIALINIPNMASNATAAFHPILSGGANKSQIAAPYTFPNTTCLAGEVLKWNATGFTCQADFGGTGNVAGPATSSSNTLAQFSDSTGKIIKGTAWTVPNSIGLPGQYLSVVGGQDLGWTNFPTTLVYVGDAPVVADNLSKFGGTDGTQIIDSGIATVNVPTMVAAAASSNTIILSNGADKTLKTTSYTVPSTIGSPNFVLKSNGTNATWQADAAGTGDVAGPATATLNSVARYESGKVIKESGIIIDDANNISGINQLNGITLNNFITGSGLVGNLPIFGLLPSELEDSGIALINIPNMASNASAAYQPILSGGSNKSQIAAPYTLPNTTCLAGEVLKWNATGFTCQTDASGSGDVAGPATATLNSIARYESGKVIKNSGILIDDANNISGVAQINSKLANNLVTGTGIGVGRNLPIYVGMSPTEIVDSGISLDNIATMATNATAGFQPILSAGLNKSQVAAPYTLPNTTCLPGEVLKWNTTGFTCQSDLGGSGAGDVAGPASATINSVALFADSSGKVLKTTDYTIPNIICPIGQILKSDGTNMTCQADVNGLTEWVAGKNYKVGEIVNTGSDANWLFKVVQDHTSVDVPADFRAGKIMAIAPPIITTGVQDGGGVTLAGNVATVQGGTGYIAKYGTSPSAWPLITIVEWTTQTITLPPTGLYTLFIDGNGVLTSASGIATKSAQDNTISAGLVDMNLGKAYDRETYPTNPVGQLRGLAFFFGGMTKGLSYVPSVTKELARTAYEVYFWGANHVDPYDPNTKSYNAMNPVQFYEFTQNGPVLPSTTKTQLRTVYDNNGILTSLGGSKWGFARIFSTLGQEDYVMYSQVQYGDEIEAKDGAISSEFIKPPELSLTKFSSWIVFKGGDNDFSDNTVTTCEPFGCDKIGSAAGGGGGAGDVFGPPASLDNTLAQFSGFSGKTLKATPYAFPITSCTSGQILKSDGVNFVCAAESGGSGLGDVVGPASSGSDTLASFNGTTGKLIKDSGIASSKIVTMDIPSVLLGNILTTGGGNEIVDSGSSLANIPIMASNATAAFQPILSGGNNKNQIAAPYTLPSTTCLAGQVLKWNVTGFTCQSDIGGTGSGLGDVLGPAGAPINSVALFSDSTGKVLKTTGYTIPNSVCLSGEVLKSDGTNLTCAPGTNSLTEWVAGKNYKAGEIVNTGSDANWLFKVVQDHTSADVPADFKAGKIMAIAPPIITTGVQDGGQTTLAGNVATVQGGTGYIAKYGTSPSAWPLITIVEWATQTITLPLTGIHTLFIDQNGQLISVSGISGFSAQDATISVGLVDMNLGTAIDRQTYPTNPVGQLRGLAFFFGGMTKGLNYSGSGLQLSRSAYEMYYWGADNSNPYDPNSKDEPAVNPVTFFEFTKNGPVIPASKKITLRNNVYDNNGTLTAMGQNKWGFVRIYSSPGVDDYVMYSQAEYGTESEAKAAAVSSTFAKPVDLELTKFSSWLVFQKGDTNFANNPITVCEPFGCDKIGTGGGGGGGGGDVLGPISSLDNSLAQFSGTNGKTLKSTPYAFPLAVCTSGQVLKSDGLNFVCAADGIGASAASIFLPSDKKLKKEIKNLPEGYIERLMDLRPVSFVWRDTLNPDMGFIAQDVSKVFPDLVEKTDDGLGINYSKLVVPIVKAFQEKVQKDEQTIKMLLERIERLEKIIGKEAKR